MLSISWSRLGSGSSSKLLYIGFIWSSSSSAPPISFEQLRSSSSSKSITWNLKVVLDFFLGGEVASLGFNLSCGVGYMHIFSLWDWHIGKGDVMVECARLFSFKNSSLVTGSNETCHSWLAGDIGFSRVIIDEGTSDNGNHFWNRTSRIRPK
jgi:hypothetical protein